MPDADADADVDVKAEGGDGGPALTVSERGEAARRRADTVLRNAEEVRRRAAAAHERYAKLVGREVEAAAGGARTDSRRSQPVGQVRHRAAEVAEKMARLAEDFAAYLEEAADRGDRDRRLRIAAIEREIAGIERRNAARLRRPDDGTPLEPLPDLHWEESADKNPGS